MRPLRLYGLTTVALGVLAGGRIQAAEYRIIPSTMDVWAGQTPTLTVEVQTEPGDNLVGVGHFSFAIDLTLTGTAGARGSDIIGSSVLINETDFDDVLSNSYGHDVGDQYLDTAGVTTDAFAPNFGSNVGDVIWLFDFDFTVPLEAAVGEMIIITPSEGFLQNLTVNDSFDPVFPQNFTPATLIVVPEPATSLLLLAGGLLMLARRART